MALSRVLEGRTVEDIEKMFSDVRCGNKPTSCSAELAKAVREAYEANKQ